MKERKLWKRSRFSNSIISFTWENLGLWMIIQIIKFDINKTWILFVDNFKGGFFLFLFLAFVPLDILRGHQFLIHPNFTIPAWKLILLFLLPGLGFGVKIHRLLQSPLRLPGPLPRPVPLPAGVDHCSCSSYSSVHIPGCNFNVFL